MKHFDYIIAGAGCAGLSLLVRLLQSGHLNDKKILLIDRSPKSGNDRTWCFWEKGNGFFEQVVTKAWEYLWFHGNGYSKLNPIAPYRYKMIRSDDFYRFCFDIIRQYPQVTVQYGEVTRLDNKPEGAVLLTKEGIVSAGYIFNSILFEKPSLKEGQYYLLQHFKGWIVETVDPVFDPAAATLMDFRIPQRSGTAFVYVMPFTATRALIEYTLFTDSLLPPARYDEGLKDYLDRFIRSDYTIIEEEFGSIPMTNYRFPSSQGHIIHIGTAGGQTKASSGYTFQFIQKQSTELARRLAEKGNPLGPATGPAWRFRFYDSTLLRILDKNQLDGSFIFTELFKKNGITDVLQFLDNETSVWKEMKLITVLPKRVFLRSALRQLFRS